MSQYHYALYHNEKFFKKPEEFHPERWLDDPEFATDDRDVFQPFQIGPRNCIGRKYVEMDIEAPLLPTFDFLLTQLGQFGLHRDAPHPGSRAMELRHDTCRR